MRNYRPTPPATKNRNERAEDRHSTAGWKDRQGERCPRGVSVCAETESERFACRRIGCSRRKEACHAKVPRVDRAGASIRTLVASIRAAAQLERQSRRMGAHLR